MRLMGLNSKNPSFGGPFAAGPLPSPPPGWPDWESLMRLALSEARKAEADGEVPVGAVVVGASGEILSTAHNRCIALSDPSAHAELLALRGAGEALANYRLEDTVLVCTLEPCLMCCGALVHARVRGLVYGAADERAGAVSSQLDGLDQPFHNHRPWHMPGILACESAELLRVFFEKKRRS
jgi:tRNA(adenine34) deaminase